MAANLDMAHAGDDLQSLAPSLELAMKGCMTQLRALRASGTADKMSSTYSAEERALKLSLASICGRLQAVREAGKARCHALLLAVLPGALQLLSTTAVLPLAQASAAVRMCVSTGEERRRTLLLPHLDAAPAEHADCERFLAERIALGSVRWLALPAAATSLLLAEHAAGLSAVESVALPYGCVDFAALPRLPCLRRLGVDARSLADGGMLSRLAAALIGLPAPLSLLRVSSLKSSLVVPFLDAIMAGGLANRLTFHQCVMPDIAVAMVCRAMLVEGGSSGVPLVAIRFEECGLSEYAEQHLLVTLEQCDGRCRVTIDGGMDQCAEEADGEVPDGHYCSPQDELVKLSEKSCELWIASDARQHESHSRQCAELEHAPQSCSKEGAALGSGPPAPHVDSSSSQSPKTEASCADGEYWEELKSALPRSKLIDEISGSPAREGEHQPCAAPPMPPQPQAPYTATSASCGSETASGGDASVATLEAKPPKSPAEAMPLQEMLAMALMRLQETRHEAELARSPGLPVPLAQAVAAAGPENSEPSASLFDDTFSFGLPSGPGEAVDEEQAPLGRSRFGFALDDTP